jgi:hypothetical protein
LGAYDAVVARGLLLYTVSELARAPGGRVKGNLVRMDGFPLAARANRAFVEQDYSTAIALYNEALEEDENNCSLIW